MPPVATHSSPRINVVTKPMRKSTPSTAAIFGSIQRPWRKRAASATAPSGAGALASAAMTAAVCAMSSFGNGAFGAGRGCGFRRDGAADEIEFGLLCRRAEARYLVVGAQPADEAAHLLLRALLVERDETDEDVVVGEIGGPAIGLATVASSLSCSSFRISRLCGSRRRLLQKRPYSQG
jgi:hypothetical protein